MPMSTYARNETMKYHFTTTSMGTRSTTWYLALHTADPTAAGTSNEVSGSSYARTAVTLSRTNSDVTNSGSVTFPTVTSTGYTVTHVSVWDASTSGNCLFYGALGSSKTLAVGDAAIFATGELDLHLV